MPVLSRVWSWEVLWAVNRISISRIHRLQAFPVPAVSCTVCLWISLSIDLLCGITCRSNSGDASIKHILTNTEEYELYRKLSDSPDKGHVIIGSGEAAAIALAKQYDGILASNNLRDVSVYVSEFELLHKTTGDIVKDALDSGLITESDGNQLWQDMLKKRRKLGYPTFSDYLKANS